MRRPFQHRPSRSSLAVALLVAVLAGCGDSTASKPTPTPSATPTSTATPAATEAASLDGCVEAGEGTVLKGATAIVGRGRVGVVTVSGPGGNACQWLELAGALADSGLRVQLSETGAGDEVGQVLANVRRLRRDGAKRIALLSTSAGGSTALAAALRAQGRLSSLVTLSAVRYGDGSDARARARRLSLPQLHIGSRGDPITNDGRDTRAFAGTGRVLVVSGAGHGTDLLADHRGLARRIARFLRNPGPVRPES